MLQPLVIYQRYPDYSGSDPNYLTTHEIHDLSVDNSKIFVLNNGPFYSQTLEIIDTATSTKLKPNDDFKVGLLNPLATAASDGSLTVFSVIELSDKWATLPTLSITYQFVGGPYYANTEGLEQAVKDLKTKPDEVYWDQIQGKPIAFPPEYHLHDASDIYGMEDTVAALYTISNSITQLAKDLAKSAVPEDTVLYGGSYKTTIDPGINLTNYKAPLVLQFPRSTNENAIVSLHATYIENNHYYEFQLQFKEHITKGFENVIFNSNFVNDLNINTVKIKKINNLNYLQINYNPGLNTNGFGSGFILIDKVIVHCDDTDDYNEEYHWNVTYPSGGTEVSATVNSI